MKMIEIASAFQAFKDHVISDIGLVRSRFNIAYGFTKIMFQKGIRTIISADVFSIIGKKWIIRRLDNARTLQYSNRRQY